MGQSQTGAKYTSVYEESTYPSNKNLQKMFFETYIKIRNASEKTFSQFCVIPHKLTMLNSGSFQINHVSNRLRGAIFLDLNLNFASDCVVLVN